MFNSCDTNIPLEIHFCCLTDYVQATQRYERSTRCKKFSNMLNWLSAARSRGHYGMHFSKFWYSALNRDPTVTYLGEQFNERTWYYDMFSSQAMVGLMGAEFSKPLVANKVTHLICYKFEGAFSMTSLTKCSKSKNDYCSYTYALLFAVIYSPMFCNQLSSCTVYLGSISNAFLLSYLLLHERKALIFWFSITKSSSSNLWIF